MRGNKKFPRIAQTFCAVLALSVGMAGAAQAQTAQPSLSAQIEMLKQQMDASAKQMEQFRQTIQALTAAQAQSEAQVKAAQAQAADAQAKATEATAKTATIDLDSNGHAFLEHKKGTALTFYVPRGEITGYGSIDVSVDDAAKNVGHTPANYSSSPPVGNWGWMPALSTNSSYFGVRGFETLNKDTALDLVYQLEAGFGLTATPGTKETNSSESNTVNGAPIRGCGWR